MGEGDNEEEESSVMHLSEWVRSSAALMSYCELEHQNQKHAFSFCYMTQG